MIYLSICIPTYNRSNYLKNTIESIIFQPEFQNSDEVEIVVSDNCSSDDTSEIMKYFVELYPEKIKYSRNTENILDKNYEKVLSLGSGQILKLNNDTLHFKSGSLGKILSIVKDCIEKNQIPFFLNGQINSIKESQIFTSVPQFLNRVSYWCTWIAGFSISKKELDNMTDFSRYADLMLTQVDVLFRLLENKNKILVVPQELFTAITPSIKGGYNLFEIFLTNYFKILSPYFITEEKKKILQIEKKTILMNYVLPSFIVYKNRNRFFFTLNGYRKIILNEFSLKELILFEIISFTKILVFKLKKKLKKILKFRI